MIGVKPNRPARQGALAGAGIGSKSSPGFCGSPVKVYLSTWNARCLMSALTGAFGSEVETKAKTGPAGTVSESGEAAAAPAAGFPGGLGFFSSGFRPRATV